MPLDEVDLHVWYYGSSTYRHLGTNVEYDKPFERCVYFTYRARPPGTVDPADMYNATGSTSPCWSPFLW